MPDHVKICTFNVNGLRNKTKRLAIFDWLNNKNNNIVFLQETHSNTANETEWKRDLRNFDPYFLHGTTSAKGVCILISKHFEYQIVDKKMDVKGCFLLLHIKCNNSEYVLCNLYSPTKDKKGRAVSFP